MRLCNLGLWPFVTINCAFAGRSPTKNGEMSERFKERAWKVRIPQKGIAGSNPALSATKDDNLKLNKIKTTKHKTII